ncbi:hypothetical protein H3143_02685 [Mycoplasma tullyi]|uniref:Lipoprotein n=1 Tax=Mycoplasma tullyi TaxID=1612150 RepID=A0A7D7U8R4_9MOLU|nr:hypothetical protein [Mycoplasma tullyi]QMT98385.1 hypothetical protein H3143_02685 [Mycoplasma tullyi]
MKRSKKILFSLGAVLPVTGGVLLTSCTQMMTNTGYNFAADADFRRAAFGNIGTINQVKNVVENSLQLPMMAPVMTPVTTSAGGQAGEETKQAEGAGGTGDAQGAGTTTGAGVGTPAKASSSIVRLVEDNSSGNGSGGAASGGSQSGDSTQGNMMNGSGAGSATTTMPTSTTAATPAATTPATMPAAMMPMASGAWKHFEDIVKSKTSTEKTTAEAGLIKFYNDFKAKFAEVLGFAGGKNLTDGTASLADLQTAKTTLETKGRELFTVYNDFGKSLGQTTMFDTTMSFEELADANKGLSNLYVLMGVNVYDFAKPVAGNSYNDLARFFEALNGFLGGQFAMNAITANVFQLFGNITALLISRELRIIDGAINSVLLTTPTTNKPGLETQLLANVNKNSTIKARYDETVKVLGDVKAQTDMWANSPIVMKTNGAQSKLEMAAAKADESSKMALTRLVGALYGNMANMNPFARKGLFASVRDLGTELDSVKNLVSSNYTKLSDFISVYKMTNATWREGVGIFVNSLATNMMAADIDKLMPASTASAEDMALFTEVKTELKRLVAATSSLPKNGAGQDKKSAFYLNQMVRSITSDNQARLASMGEGVEGFSFYVNTAL